MSKPGHMSNAARARYFARIIAHLVGQASPDGVVKIPLSELENQAAPGFAVQDGQLVIALGDKP